MLLLIWLSPVVLREFAVSHYSLTVRDLLANVTPIGDTWAAVSSAAAAAVCC